MKSEKHFQRCPYNVLFKATHSAIYYQLPSHATICLKTCRCFSNLCHISAGSEVGERSLCKLASRQMKQQDRCWKPLNKKWYKTAENCRIDVRVFTMAYGAAAARTPSHRLIKSINNNRPFRLVTHLINANWYIHSSRSANILRFTLDYWLVVVVVVAYWNHSASTLALLRLN